MPNDITERIVSRLKATFISDTLRDDTLSDSGQRAVVLVMILLVSAVSGASLTLALSALCASSGDPLHLIAASIAALTLAGYLGTLWYFKHHQKLIPAANLYGLTTTFSTVAPATITGGMSTSPYLLLVLVVPIFLFLIAGRKSGTYWSLVVILCVAFLLIIESLGVVFPQVFPEVWILPFKFLTWITTLGLLILGLLSYESNFEALNERIHAERSQFAHEAMHDPLTGLSNRKLFFSRATDAVDYALAREHKAAIIYVDLDNFKTINDDFGHEMGDEVLNLVAQRLQDNIRSSDTVARLGGDEFAVVLHGIEQTEVAEQLAEKLRRALREPLIIGQHSLMASGSLGIAIAPDQGKDIDQLLSIADAAMYRAKGSRKLSFAEG